MNYQGDNKLLYGYNQNYSQNYNPFMHNQLLQNNPMFANNASNQSNANMNQSQLLQMQKMQQMQMQKIKEFQQIKINEMENRGNKQYNDKIKESVIQPYKLNEKKDRIELEQKWKNAEESYIDKSGKNYGPEIQKYWKARTNAPYKSILKEENVSKNFKTKDDLVVHRVTAKDKEGVDDKHKEMNDHREKHNGELKVIYSTNHKSEHKKKFEYNHVYKYRVQYDPKSHGDLKQDKIKYYKEQQKKEEGSKQLQDSILDCLDEIFSPDELNSIGLNKKEAYLNRKNNK